jgi:DnaD/phage-associated family protein
MSNHSVFVGFGPSDENPVSIPGILFRDLLAEIDDLAELKLTIYLFWRLNQSEGDFPYIKCQEIQSDAIFMAGLGQDSQAAGIALANALDRAVARRTVLRSLEPEDAAPVEVFFLNTPRGRAAVQAISQGNWRAGRHGDTNLPVERPNIYRLYEQNIGPLTPIIAETLRDAENEYSPEWIEEAVQIAVEKNARNWRYVAAILRSWKEKGRDEQDRRDSQKDSSRYRENEFADFIDN